MVRFTSQYLHSQGARPLVLIELGPGWATEPVWNFRREKNFLPNSCFFSTTPRPSLGPTQPPTHRIPPAVLRRVKHPTNETGHLSVCNAVLRGLNLDAPWFIFSLWFVKCVGYFLFILWSVISKFCRFQWPRGLRLASGAAS